MVKILHTSILTLFFLQAICAQAKSSFSAVDTTIYLNIPERPAYAIEGSDFVAQVTGLSIRDRETAVVREILSGNVPSFSRKLGSLKISQNVDATNYELIYFVACDTLLLAPIRIICIYLLQPQRHSTWLIN